MGATRILALDPGTKRIGVALSDELGWTAQPLETFERKSPEADAAHIKDLVRRHDVREIVMGMPVHLSGRVGPAAQSAQRFLEMIQAATGVPVVAWDERLTTKAAEQLLIDADVSRKKRKGAVDRVAAALLLKSYLEHLTSDKA
jgi:putative Holliday junction resolvase